MWTARNWTRMYASGAWCACGCTGSRLENLTGGHQNLKGTKMVGRTSWKAWWQMIGYQMFDLRANCRTSEVQSCIWSAVVHLSVLSFLWLLLFILIVKTWANQFMDVVIFERNLLKSISGEDIQWDLITLQLLYVLVTRVSLLTTKNNCCYRVHQKFMKQGFC